MSEKYNWLVALIATCLALWSANAKAERVKDGAPVVASKVSIFDASIGYVYYNRPGADLVVHNEELAFCIAEAQTMLPSATSFQYGGFVITGAAYNSMAERLGAARVEGCMVVRGWRVVRVPESEGVGLAELPQSDLAIHLTPWIGAREPHGEIVRDWNNDGIRVSARKTSKPKFVLTNQLSWAAAATQGLAIPATNYYNLNSQPKLDKIWRVGKGLMPSELAKAPLGSALLVFRTIHADKSGFGVAFVRAGKNMYERPAVDDRAPDFVQKVATKFDEEWMIQPIPAGSWRFYAFGGVNFCLGAPGFEVKAGDVIFAGTFDLGSEDMRPSLDMMPVKNFLAGTSAADIVQPAAYTNGIRLGCWISGINYAIELENAPFDPDYRFGSLAKQ